MPGITVRASAAAIAGLIGLGALALGVAVLIGAGQIVALYQAGNFDLLGAIVVTLIQFAYLPTFIVWGLSFVAGPGFALGTGTAVSPAGTQVGVVPGVPVLGAVPESTTTWLLLLVLLPIGVGAFAGWIARSRFAAALRPPAPPRAPKAPSPFAAGPLALPAETGALDEDRRTALVGLLTPGGPGATRGSTRRSHRPNPRRSRRPPWSPSRSCPGSSSRWPSRCSPPGHPRSSPPSPPARWARAASPRSARSLVRSPSPSGSKWRWVPASCSSPVAERTATASRGGTVGRRADRRLDVRAASRSASEEVAEPLPEHAPTPELGAAAALARWAAARSAEPPAPPAADEEATAETAPAPREVPGPAAPAAAGSAASAGRAGAAGRRPRRGHRADPAPAAAARNVAGSGEVATTGRSRRIPACSRHIT